MLNVLASLFARLEVSLFTCYSLFHLLTDGMKARFYLEFIVGGEVSSGRASFGGQGACIYCNDTNIFLGEENFYPSNTLDRTFFIRTSVEAAINQNLRT